MEEKVNILIVDDVPEKIMALEAILECLGQNIISVNSGADALRRLLIQDFAVILLDVRMPIMDGFETARMIRQRKRSEHTPIIFVTAMSDEMLTAQGYALGAVDYILSPVVPEILRTKIGVFVELYVQNRQLRRQAEQRVALAHEQAARAVAEEANRRLVFLAEASNTLTNSLDLGATKRDLLRLVVPALADLATLTLLDESAQPWRCELAWLEPGSILRTHSLTAPETPNDALRAVNERVLSTGQIEMLDPLHLVYPPGDLALPAGWLRSAVALPLRARGRTLGVLTLARAESRVETPDLDLMEDLAGRAAISLDNARLYRELQENDRRKTEFLALLGHELRNPLAPIRSTVEFLHRIRLDRPELEQARDRIERQVRLLTRLVDDLLDVSRITSGKIRLRREPLDFNAVAAQAVEIARPLIESRQHELVVSIPDGSLWVDGDPARLAQVLANLLNNAAKFTEPGGRIVLSVEQKLGQVEARVRDNGVGLTAEMLPRIFELFTQVDRVVGQDQGGLGVGLSLVRRLVEMHGGRVEAFSAGPGLGCEFVITLPRLETVPKRPTRVKTAVYGPPRRVLVVDDNVDGAESLASLLRLRGHQVHVANDGPEALRSATAFHPEIVVLDIGLPGMDGYEVARRLRDSQEAAPARLVALTGFGQDEDRRLSREAGFDYHLVKPVDPTMLEELLCEGTSA